MPRTRRYIGAGVILVFNGLVIGVAGVSFIFQPGFVVDLLEPVFRITADFVLVAGFVMLALSILQIFLGGFLWGEGFNSEVVTTIQRFRSDITHLEEDVRELRIDVSELNTFQDRLSAIMSDSLIVGEEDDDDVEVD